MYEIDGGDAEYWKYFDAEGNRIMGEDVQTYSGTGSSGTTLKSPYNGVTYDVLSGYEVSHAIDVSKLNPVFSQKFVLVITAIMTLIIGIYPEKIIELCRFIAYNI